MHFVYILQSILNRKLYVGRTSRLRERMIEHQNRKVWATKRMGKCELIMYEAFKSKKDAIRRERYFKTSKGKSSLKQIIRASLLQ